jgi:hypothetical protein
LEKRTFRASLLAYAGYTSVDFCADVAAQKSTWPSQFLFFFFVELRQPSMSGEPAGAGAAAAAEEDDLGTKNTRGSKRPSKWTDKGRARARQRARLDPPSAAGQSTDGDDESAGSDASDEPAARDDQLVATGLPAGGKNEGALRKRRSTAARKGARGGDVRPLKFPPRSIVAGLDGTFGTVEQGWFSSDKEFYKVRFLDGSPVATFSVSQLQKIDPKTLLHSSEEDLSFNSHSSGSDASDPSSFCVPEHAVGEF